MTTQTSIKTEETATGGQTLQTLAARRAHAQAALEAAEAQTRAAHAQLEAQRRACAVRMSSASIACRPDS